MEAKSMCLKIFYSRRVSPTRRVAINTTTLNQVMFKRFAVALMCLWRDSLSELTASERQAVVKLVDDILMGKRPSSRLRHRLQGDTTGLSECTVNLSSNGKYDLIPAGDISAPQIVLGVAMTLEGGLPETKDLLITLKKMRSHGECVEVAGEVEPWVEWAKNILGVPDETLNRERILGSFREAIRSIHPDSRLAKINETDSIEATIGVTVQDVMRAKRILLEQHQRGWNHCADSTQNSQFQNR